MPIDRALIGWLSSGASAASARVGSRQSAAIHNPCIFPMVGSSLHSRADAAAGAAGQLTFLTGGSFQLPSIIEGSFSLGQ